MRKIERVEVDRDVCVGSAFCADIAPGVFEMDDQMVATVRDITAQPDDRILEAAKGCPVEAIRLFDASGEQLYPPK
jgi:ferredoxin